MDVVAGARRRRAGRGAGEQRGFTLIEVLVAALLVLVIVLGVIPLFMRSIVSNTGGNDYTQLSNFGKSRVEELFQLDFSNPRLSIPAGQTELEFNEYWSQTDKEWLEGSPPTGLSTFWTRSTVVRQYNISAIDETIGTLDVDPGQALDGNAPLNAVHLKEIVTTVRSERQGPLGPGRELTLRTLKAK